MHPSILAWLPGRLARPLHLLLLSPAPSLLSLTHAQTHSLSTEIPLSGICGHSLCALMGKRRHPISPLAGPAGCGLMKKLLSKAIRALIASGPAASSPWPSEGLWSVDKQCEDSLHPGTLSYCFPWCGPNTPAVQPALQDTASHSTQEN